MKQKETRRLREWIYGCQGEGWGHGIFREKGMVKDLGVDMYTLLYLKWVTKKDLLCSTGNFVQCYAAAWMESEFGDRVDTSIFMAESLYYSPETITHCLLKAIPQYKIENLKKKKERQPSLLFAKYKRDLKFSERK